MIRDFKNKDEFIKFIDITEGVKIKNIPNDYNKKRKFLYAYVCEFDIEKVEKYLRRRGLRIEKHMNNYYWLQIKH